MIRSLLFCSVMVASLAGAPSAHAQLRAHIEVLGEYHRLPSLRTYQRDLADAMEDVGLQGTERVASYPPFVGFRVHLGFSTAFLSDHYAGVVLATSSTGARTAYRASDVAVYVDQTVSFRSFGILYEHVLGEERSYEPRRAVPFLYAQPLLEWSQLQQQERIDAADGEQHTNTYTTLQPSAELGGGFRFPMGATYVRAALGAYWRMPRAFTSESAVAGTLSPGGTTLRLRREEGDVMSDGFGVRLGLSFGVGLER